MQSSKSKRSAVVDMHDFADGDVVLDIDDQNRPEENEEDDGEDPSDPTNHDNDIDDSVHAFTGHEDSVYSTAWNQQNSNMVATGGGDDRAYIWQTGAVESSNFEETTFELRGHSDSVACLQFNRQGNLLASGGLDGQVRIWSTSNGQCLQTFDGPTEGIEWLSWHPKGDIILAGSEDFSVWMWNASSGVFMQAGNPNLIRMPQAFNGHSGPVRCGQFTPDGKQVVTCGGEGDNSLKVWDPRNGACTLTVLDTHFYHSEGLTALDIRQDSLTACTGSEDSTARLLNLQTGRVLGTLTGHTDSIEAVRFIGDTSLLATCSLDGTLRIWETSYLALRATCSHPEGVVGLLCHPSGPFLYTSCLDGSVRSWDARTGTCLQTQHGHKEGIQAMSLSPNGQYVVTGSDDCTARVFEFSFANHS